MTAKCRNGQKWNTKNERSENLSLSQIFSSFTILLLSLVFVSSCDAPSSPHQNPVQNKSTPLPTIVARNFGNQQAFCNGTVEQTAWSGTDNVRQVNAAVPPPVPPGLIAGYSVGEFDAPCIMPKVGVVRFEAFIQTEKAFDYFYGNDRNFNPEFDPADTKASIILDFTKGGAQVIISPTCHVKIGNVNPDCAYANSLTDKNGAEVNWFRWKVDPAVAGFPPGTEFLTIQYAFTIAAIRAGWRKQIGRHIIPPINGLIHFAFEPDTGNVCLKGTIDDFPATAIHQVHYDSSGKATAITLARHQEARLLGPVGLTDPWHWTEAHIGNQCGQILTGLAPTTSPKTGIIETIAGNGQIGESTDEVSATESTTPLPTDVAVDKDGNVYIAQGSQVRYVSPDGIIRTIAGSYSGTGSIPNGIPATSASFSADALTLDSSNNLYIADTSHCKVYKVDQVTGIITTIAGSGSKTETGDGGPATQAGLNGPTDVAVDKNGNIYIADYWGNKVRRVDAQTGIISTYAGTGSSASKGNNVPAASASFRGPSGLTINSTGDLYISDGDSLIHRVSSSTGLITTVAGSTPFDDFIGNTQATQCLLEAPTHMAVDSADNLYIADGFASYNGVYRLDAANTMLTLVVGTGRGGGYAGDGGPALAAVVNQPEGVAIDSVGNLYIADTQNSRVRIVYGG